MSIIASLHSHRSRLFLPTLLPDNISTSLTPHPNLMPPSRIHIQSPAYPKRLFRGLRIIRVRDRELSGEDEVGGQAGVLVGWVVCVAGRVST